MTYAEASGWNHAALPEGTLVIDEIAGVTRGFARGPIRALMSALLFDGVQAYLSYFSSEASKSIARYREALAWVNTRGTEYIFSFDCVCEGLGIEPDYLRLGLINAVTAQKEKRKKSRRTF